MIVKKCGAVLLAGILVMSCMGCGEKGAQESTEQKQEESSASKEPSASEEESAPEEPDEEEVKGEEQTPVEISIGGWPKEDTDPSRYAAMEKSKEEFEDVYPWITIKEETWGYSVSEFLPKAAANQLPDLGQTYFTELTRIVEAGYASDLTEMMDQYGYTDKLDDNVRELVTIDGKIYYVPQSIYTLGLVANRGLFEEAGVLNEDGTIPWPDTWEELGELAGKIKEKTGKIGFQMPTMTNTGGWLFTNIAWSYGTEFIKHEDGKWVAAFNSEECAAALQFVHDLKWKYNALSDNLFVDSNEYYSTYGSEQVAMMIGDLGYSNMSWYIDQYQTDPSHMAWGKMPAGPKGRFALSGGSVYMVPNSVALEKYDALFKWMDYTGIGPEMTAEAEENYDALIKGYAEKGVPVLDRLWSDVWKGGDSYEKKNAIHKKYANANMDNFNSYLDNADVTLHAEPEVCAQELYSILDNCIQEVLQDENADIPAILERAANDFQVNYLDNEN